MDSKLQIISGKYKGKKLRIPPCSRPTQQKARGAVFNMLAEFVANGDWFVWDAFAGSGAMGMEFISRFNAKSAIFTDVNASAVRCVKENTKNISDCEIIIGNRDAGLIPIKTLATFIIQDVTSPHSNMMPNRPQQPLSQREKFIVFIDPPYSGATTGQQLVDKLAQNAPIGMIIIWEMEAITFNPIIPIEFTILRDKIYGRARFLILQKKQKLSVENAA